MTIEAGAEFGARILASLDGLAGELRADRERRARAARMYAAAHIVPIMPGQIPLTAGAGTLDQGGAGLLGPMRGYYWTVKRLTAAGFTAGTVSMYINGAPAALDAAPDVSWPEAGMYTFGNGELLLNPQDRLIFVASGITGIVLVKGSAIQFPEELLPRFLGLEY